MASHEYRRAGAGVVLFLGRGGAKPLRVKTVAAGPVLSQNYGLMRMSGVLLFAVTVGACAATQQPYGRTVSDSAEYYLAHPPAWQRLDCSGFVEVVLARAGAEVQGNSRTFWADAERDGRVVQKPMPGDLAFFDRTYDANRNGRVDDALTHVAVVTAVEPDGTVVMVHRGSQGIRPLRLNLARRHDHRDGERVLNDFLRSPSYGGEEDARLAGELFHGFARPPRRGGT
jgi:hypothetical protein